MSTIDIFLVEDNEDDRFLFERALRKSTVPCTFSSASHAAEAVSRLNRFGIYAGVPLPDLIILDLGLPGIPGKVLLQVIRNAYGPQHVPVVVLTGSDMPADRADCALWGISAYMRKPSTFAGMGKLVETLPSFTAPQGRIATGTPSHLAELIAFDE